MTSISFEDRIKLAGEYQKWALNYVVYTYFADPPMIDGSEIYANGTSTLIDTGTRKFAVTNDHVIKFYEDLKKDNSEINFQIGSLVIDDIKSRIIDRSKHYDLVTYELNENEVESLNKQYCPSSNWPPKQVTKGELLIFAGYPGIFRQIKFKGHVSFESAIILDEVVSTTPEFFKIEMDMDNYDIFMGSRKLEELTDLGGFSGAGVFRINNDKFISSLEPVGILFQGINKWRIQCGSHIDLIESNGKIK